MYSALIPLILNLILHILILIAILIMCRKSGAKKGNIQTKMYDEISNLDSGAPLPKTVQKKGSSGESKQKTKATDKKSAEPSKKPTDIDPLYVVPEENMTTMASVLSEAPTCASTINTTKMQQTADIINKKDDDYVTIMKAKPQNPPHSPSKLKTKPSKIKPKTSKPTQKPSKKRLDEPSKPKTKKSETRLKKEKDDTSPDAGEFQTQQETTINLNTKPKSRKDKKQREETEKEPIYKVVKTENQTSRIITEKMTSKMQSEAGMTESGYISTYQDDDESASSTNENADPKTGDASTAKQQRPASQ